jgi:hypothetical protein
MFVLIATFSFQSVKAKSPQIIHCANGVSSVVTGSDGSLVLTENGSTMSGPFRFEGTLQDDVDAFAWPQNVHFTGAKAPDNKNDDEKSVEARVTISHGAELSEGVLKAGTLTRFWPSLANQPGALAFVWFVGNQVAYVDVRPVPTAESYLSFGINLNHRLSHADAEHCRVGVIAIQNGQLLKPKKTNQSCRTRPKSPLVFSMTQSCSSAQIQRENLVRPQPSSFSQFAAEPFTYWNA